MCIRDRIWIDKDGNMGSMVITGPSEEQKRAYEDRKIEKKKENEQKLVELSLIHI